MEAEDGADGGDSDAETELETDGSDAEGTSGAHTSAGSNGLPGSPVLASPVFLLPSTADGEMEVRLAADPNLCSPEVGTSGLEELERRCAATFLPLSESFVLRCTVCRADVHAGAFGGTSCPSAVKELAHGLGLQGGGTSLDWVGRAMCWGLKPGSGVSEICPICSGALAARAGPSIGNE